MGMFGNNPDPRSEGTFAPLPMAAPPPLSLDLSNPQVAKRPINWGGLIADAMAGFANPGQPGPFMQMQEQRRQEAMQLAAEQRRRAADFADFTARQDYQRAHPAPVNNDTVNDYQFIASKLGPEAADQYLRSVSMGPPVAVQGIDANGNSTTSYVPRAQVYGGGGQSNRPAIGSIMPDPRKAGGPTPSASGGFR
jgi:hypothetical protein